MRYEESPLSRKIEKFVSPKRVNKDTIERDLTEAIFQGDHETVKEKKREGSVVTLTGPDAERHITIYEKHFPVIIIVEQDKKLARHIQETIRQKRKEFSSDIFVRGQDVFLYEHKEHLPPVKLIDLDFTHGWTAHLENQVVHLIRKFPDAWVRVTYNARSHFSFSAIRRIREIATKIEYRAVEEGPGDPMVTAQFKPFNKNYVAEEE